MGLEPLFAETAMSTAMPSLSALKLKQIKQLRAEGGVGVSGGGSV